MQKNIINIAIALFDFFVLNLLFYMTYFIIENLHKEPIFEKLSLIDFIFVIVIIFILMIYEKIYRFRYDFWQDTLKIFKAFFIGYIIVSAILFLSKSQFLDSRLFITIYFLLGIIILPIAKRIFKKILFKKTHKYRSKTYIVGIPKEKNKLKDELKNNWYIGQIYSKDSYDNVFIISQALSIEQLNSYISQYIQKTTEVFVIPFITQINFAHSHILEYSNIRYSAIQIENKLLIKSNLFIKNLFDLIVSILLLPIFLIMHIIISIAIKLDDSGSIFFKQKRLGKDGKVFEVYKYRTMYQDSDDILQQYLQNHPQEIEYYQKYHKYINDPRITKIGKFLRSTSLDELPQILNVLKGEMSLVGPRPYMLDEESLLYSAKHLILQVKPGITGLWQVSGRNNLTFQERTELESWYIKNWSLWFDFVIIVKTIKVVLLKVGAR